MKFKQITAVTYDDSEKISSIDSGEVSFTDLHNGSFEAIVPCSLPGVGNAKRFETVLRISLTGETSQNAKGKCRVLVKATTQYKAIRPDASNLTPAEYCDSTRSGGEISAHMVLSVARSVRDDLMGANGALAKRNALAQIHIVLNALLGLRAGTTVGGFADGHQAPVSDLELGEDIPIDPLVVTETAANMVIGARPGNVTIETVGSYSSKGFQCYDPPEDGGFLDDPLVRGLYGLAPLADDKVAILPSIVLPVLAQ